MSDAATMDRDWSAGRWLGTVAAVFVLQLAFIWMLSKAPATPAASRNLGISISLSPASVSTPNEVQNPTLLALPEASGFSGNAWLRYLPLAHELSAWSEPPRWLGLADNPAPIGQSFSEFVAANRPALLRMTDQRFPLAMVTEPATPRLPLPERSTVELEGDIVLESAAFPELPSWQSNQQVSNSVVRITIERDGPPFSCLLVGTCGLREADDYAVRVVSRMRFRSRMRSSDADARGLKAGRLVFKWHTVAIPAAARAVTTVP